MSDEGLPKAIQLLKKSKNIVVFTGAGISAESNIPTFRGKGGMWEKHNVQELANPYAFEADPKKVWEWYDWRRKMIHDAQPNPGHKIIALMEEHFSNLHVVTQNIDGLHKRAGSRNIVELHGNVWRVRCMKEGKIFEFTEVPLSKIPPQCQCGSIVRPDVVWFGEAMPVEEVNEAFLLAESCDLMLVVGTSALVQPAASIPFAAKQSGAAVIEINIDVTPVSRIADVSLFGKAGDILPELWESFTGIK